jgi:broad specificity phosphatase PhoE
MPIHILRHEERDPQNPLFESALTPNGMQNADKLVHTLQALHIDRIYCSPFLRTVQTVYPYCTHTKKTLCIEHALYESLDNALFTQYNYKYTWCDLPSKYHNIINRSYTSMVKTVPLYESFEDVCVRVKPFWDSLLVAQERDQSPNTLVVSHLTTCEALIFWSKKCVNKEPTLEMGEIVRVV